MSGFGIAASKSGRAAIALPLDDVFKLAGAAMAFVIIALSLILWPIVIFWHELCWAVMISIIPLWARKTWRAYKS